MTYIWQAEGPKIRSDQDAVEVIAAAFEQGVSTVLIPVERFEEEFFRLHTGIAGAIFQKFATYRVRLVVVGDISRYQDESAAFRDLVYETNRGQAVWFYPDRNSAEAALSGTSPRSG